MKTKFFTKPIMAVLVALVMLCSCFNIFKLDNSISAEANMPPNNQLNTYDTLYYFSDSSNASTFASYVVNMSIVQTVHLASLTPTLDNYVYEMYVTESYKNISNAYIIFEFLTELSFDSHYVLDLTHQSTMTRLETIFSWWKLHNCSIMCVCGTDEDVIGPDYNGFLTYTDIHVNTHVFIPFIDDILYNSTMDCGGNQEVENCTFILNETFSRGVLDDGLQGFYFHYFFCPFYLAMYEGYMTANNLVKPAQLFYAKSINFFCRIGEDLYYDPVLGLSYTFEQLCFLSAVTDCEHLYGLCLNYSTTGIDSGWLYDMYELRNVLNNDFEIYVYDSVFYSSTAYDYDNVFVAWCDMTLVDDIKIDFITDDEDLLYYNNYSGRSPISHKILSSATGGDGYGAPWLFMLTFGGGGSIIFPWHHRNLYTIDYLNYLYDYDGSCMP